MLFLSADRLTAGPDGKRTAMSDSTATQIERSNRKAANGRSPFAALSGGVSDVRSLEQCHPNPTAKRCIDHEGILEGALSIIGNGLETDELLLCVPPTIFTS